MNVSRELLKLGEAGSGVELAVRGLGIMGDTEVEVDEKTRGRYPRSLCTFPLFRWTLWVLWRCITCIAWDDHV